MNDVSKHLRHCREQFITRRSSGQPGQKLGNYRRRTKPHSLPMNAGGQQVSSKNLGVNRCV